MFGEGGYIYQTYTAQIDENKDKKKQYKQAKNKQPVFFLSKKNSTRNESKQSVKKAVTTQNKLSPPKLMIMLSVGRKKKQNV